MNVVRLIQIIIGVTQLYPQAWYESRKYGRSTRVIIKHLRIRELKKTDKDNHISIQRRTTVCDAI